MIPYSRHEITEEDKKAVLEVLSSDWLAGNGPITRQFEDALCEYTGYSNCVVLNSCTAALHLAFIVALEKYETIQTSNLTFVASVNAILLANKQARVVDPNRDTYLVDFNSKFDYFNGASVPVSFAGYPSNNAIVSDDAHYIQNSMAFNRDVEVSAGSTHAVKSICSAEGGYVLTNNGYFAQRIRQLADHGRLGGLCEEPGYNYRMPSLNAALGLSQLKRLDMNIWHKSEIADSYYKHWKHDNRIILPPNHPNHAWHLFVIRLPNCTASKRDRFRLLLKENNVATQVHYPPITSLPLYHKQRDRIKYGQVDSSAFYQERDFDEFYGSLVSIPIFASMTWSEVEIVQNTIDLALDQLEIEYAK